MDIEERYSTQNSQDSKPKYLQKGVNNTVHSVKINKDKKEEKKRNSVKLEK